MRTNDEIFKLVLSRREEHTADKKRRSKQFAAIAAAVVCVFTALAITLSRAHPEFSKSGVNKPLTSRTEEQNEEPFSEAAANITAADGQSGAEQPEPEAEQKNNQKNEKTVSEQKQAESKLNTSTHSVTKAIEETSKRNSQKPESVPENATAPDEYSGGNHGPVIPVIPAHAGAKEGINVTGEKITDAEAKAYFDENGASITSALAASGVPADNIRISEKGYSHISYDGTEGKQLELRQNFRDYIVYNGDSIVAIVTLCKENGKLYNTPAFGAPWFSAYNSYLNAHKGQKLLYVYAGPWELIIAPDGTYASPNGSDVTSCLEGVKNPYQYFYSEGATYTP